VIILEKIYKLKIMLPYNRKNNFISLLSYQIDENDIST